MVKIINGPQAGGGQISINQDESAVVVLHGQDNAVTGATTGDVAILGGGGHNSVDLGYAGYPTGNDAVLLGGDSNDVSILNGTAYIATPGQSNTIHVGGDPTANRYFSGRFDVAVGSDDTVRMTNGTSGSEVVAGGAGDMVFLYSSAAAVDDLGGNLSLTLGPVNYNFPFHRDYVGDVVVRNFQNDPNGLIDLGPAGGGTNVGGYTDFSQVQAALRSDGHGGTVLPLGTTGSIDFVGDTHLSANNFAFG